MRWNPNQYAKYNTERNRPFFDLVGQVGADSATRVVDLGCGPGELTATLADRWPDAVITGIDSSPEMIERAQDYRSANVTFELGQAQDFDATGVDVLVSNALLQWVPGHHQLLARWAAELSPLAWLAFQVPDNFSSPSHVLMRELAESDRWQAQLGGLLRHDDAVSPAEDYLSLLTDAGLSVTVWQTRYVHVLTGPDPVLEWVRGTGLRPVLGALSTDDAAEFERTYAAQLRQAYPASAVGTVFPFLRTFAVGHKR